MSSSNLYVLVPFNSINLSSILRLPEFFKIIISNNPSENFARGAALKPPPRKRPLATTAIVILDEILLSPSITILHSLLLYAGTVATMLATVDTKRLFIFLLTLLDLSIISAPTPISAAFNIILLWVKDGEFLSVITANIVSIFRLFICLIRFNAFFLLCFFQNYFFNIFRFTVGIIY